MVRSNLTRRDFTKLAAAAFGGVVTGTLVGCGDEKSDKSDSKSSAGSDTKVGIEAPKTDVAYLMNDKNVCHNLNTCKNNGKGTHDCAGKSSCHNLTADQSCGGKNECKGQGGCKGAAGINECKTQGGCAVPLNDDAWAATRKLFEAQWKKEKPDTALGSAPAKPK